MQPQATLAKTTFAEAPKPETAITEAAQPQAAKVRSAAALLPF